jgi:DNA-binding response OmpR family regulator
VAAHLNIVVVEDNDDLRSLLCAGLLHAGHRVTGLASAEALEDQTGLDHVDAFLIDINLPGEDGLSLARRVRRAQPLVGIVILSARSALDDKLKGYDDGADIYLTKPVAMPELLAALRSFARRRSATLSQMTSEALTLNKLDLQGSLAAVKLTPQEATVLTAMARAPAGRLETWQLAELLGADTDEAFKASLAVRMVRLRKKLTDAGAQDVCIESLRNIGYQLTTPVVVL